MTGSSKTPIPPLFPACLQDICVVNVLKNLTKVGKKVEERAQKDLEILNEDADFDPDVMEEDLPFLQTRNQRRSSFLSELSEYLDSTLSHHTTTTFPRTRTKKPSRPTLTKTKYFCSRVKQCRSFITDLISSQQFDALIEIARREGNIVESGYLFVFSVLCNERLTKLVGCRRDENFSGNPIHCSDSDWTDFLGSSLGCDLFQEWLWQLKSLASLTVQNVCTDEMLFIIGGTCTRLQVLDISYSESVTDLGLLYLCGDPEQSYNAYRSSGGCRYLREIHLNPPGKKTITPRVVAFLLKHLNLLEVVNIPCLKEAVECYSRGLSTTTNRRCHVRTSRIPMLNLRHYTGIADLDQDFMHFCPKLRTFRFFVSESLPILGSILEISVNVIDQVTLVFPSDWRHLNGLHEFLSQCGDRITSLHVECGEESVTEIRLEDLKNIRENCPFLEVLGFTNFQMEKTALTTFPQDHDRFLKLTFLTELRLSNVLVDGCCKQIILYILGGCPELERLYISFNETSTYFSDFFLDEVFDLNPISRLEHFFVVNASLTLITALRLISSRPKLKLLGRVLDWDVEERELSTFTKILRRANGMKALQDITIL